MHDVVIVGARAAGAATALLLARAGHDVLVLDRDRLGADTLSTHALMRPAVLQLERWGLLDELAATGTPPQRRVVFHYGAERVDLELARALYAPRRTVLDPLLVRAAEAAGATVRFGVDVRDVAWSRGRVRGVVVRTRTGDRELRGRVTVGADGRSSRIAAAVRAPVTRRGREAAAALYGYWSGLEADGFEWAYAPGAAAGLVPTGEGLVCVYAGVPRDRFLGDLRGDLPGALETVLGEVGGDLRARVAAARRVGHVRGFAGLVGSMRRPRGPGWALVGDAGFFKDPITAHGITDALRDAELLARDLHADLGGHPRKGRSYERTRDRLGIPILAHSDRVAGFTWDLPTLQQHHLALSEAMGREYDHLATLGPLVGGVPVVANREGVRVPT